MNRIELEIDLKPKELTEYQKNSIVKYFFSLQNSYFLLITYMFVMFVFKDIRIMQDYFDYLGYLVIAVLIIFVYYSIKLMRTKEYSKKFCSQSVRYKNTFKCRITDAGIRNYFQSASKFFEWQEFKKVSESKLIFNLILKDSSNLYIPKSAFKTDEELDFFRSCIKNIKR